MSNRMGKLARSSRLVAELKSAVEQVGPTALEELMELLSLTLVEALRSELQIKVDFGIVSIP